MIIAETHEEHNWAAPADSGRHCREMRGAARLAPPSWPLAATLIGGLRPGSLRVHAPCKETGHGSRLGFPGRRTPGGPAASGNVARGLRVPLRGKPRERRVREEPRICRTPDDRTSANGWRRLGAQPPGGEFRHRSFLPDGIMVREVSEDGWGGRRQDPLATEVAAGG